MTNTHLKKRIIPCLDVSEGKVVKGVRFRDHEVVGDITELAARYRDEGADELVLYDITASPEARSVDCHWITDVARVLDIPFCVAGGIDSVPLARQVLNAGADKVSINSPAILRPRLIAELASEFGRQCVVVGVDSVRTAQGHKVRKLTGKPDQARDAGHETLEWLRTVQELGAGEIVLNSIDEDGVRRGYDLALLSEARRVCTVPLIASGGAGSVEHFIDVFRTADVDGALAASIFHRRQVAISDVKSGLTRAGVAVRP